MNLEKLNDRQKRIIQFAGKQEFFQTKDALAFIGDEFDVERLTVVRDLSFLTEEKVLVKSGKGRSVSYAMSPFYLLVRKIDVDQYFSMPNNDRDAKPIFDESVIDLLNEDIFTKEEMKRLEKAKNKYNAVIEPLKQESPAIFKKEWERLIIDLAWKSSEIEGNTYTLLETESLIKEMELAKGKNKTEAQMILNHKKALDYILLNPDYFEEIDIKKIKTIHKLLVEDIGIKIDLRDRPVGITGTIYRPLTKSNDISQAVERLTKKMKIAKNPFLKAFSFLIMLAYIQAFEDGNKRTSRIVSNAILHADGIPMLSYRNIEAMEYKKAMLLFYEQNNISYIKKIFIEQLEFSAENYFG